MTNREGLVCYPLQLRLGLWIFLYLPPRMTREDVERIVSMLEQLPIPEFPS